jgi:hypothetical protein
MLYLTELKALAERLEVINSHEVQGCTEAEIQALEDTLQIKLPEAYREFLVWGGKGTIEFLRGSTWRYFKGNFVDLQIESKDLLIENHPLELPINTYIFLAHQGSIFFFFLLTEGDNPVIYKFMEGETEFRKEFCAFTEFLEYHLLYAYLVDNKSIRENFYWLKEQYTPYNQ